MKPLPRAYNCNSFLIAMNPFPSNHENALKSHLPRIIEFPEMLKCIPLDLRFKGGEEGELDPLPF